MRVTLNGTARSPGADIAIAGSSSQTAVRRGAAGDPLPRRGLAHGARGIGRYRRRIRFRKDLAGAHAAAALRADGGQPPLQGLRYHASSGTETAPAARAVSGP